MAYPRFQRAQAFRTYRRTSGNITLNSTTWANVDTGADLTIEAQVGDVIEVGINCIAGNEAVDAWMDVGFLVSAAINSSVGSGEITTTTGDGILGWLIGNGVQDKPGPPAHKTLVAGDIDANGRVTARLRYRTASATAKTIYAGTANPFLFYAKNLGPADPE